MKDNHILLVEDNPDDVALTIRAFKKSNIVNEVVVAEDGAVALNYLFGEGMSEGRDTSDMPTVILLDLQLPKVSGFEVLSRVRASEKTKLLPVIILTSSREDEDVMNGYSMGANSFIRKPVDFDRFVEAVLQLKSYWLMLNEPPPTHRHAEA